MRSLSDVAAFLARPAALSSLLSCASDDACDWLADQVEACAEPMSAADVANCKAGLEPCTRSENEALVSFLDCVVTSSESAFCSTPTTGAYADFVSASVTCAETELTSVSDACLAGSGFTPPE